MEKDLCGYWSIPDIKNNLNITNNVDIQLIIPKTPMQILMKIVLEEYGMTLKEVYSLNRTRPLPDIRNLICYFAFKILEIRGAAEIAEQVFPNGNHSHVFNAIKRIQHLLDVHDPEITKAYTNILTILKIKFPHKFIK